MGRLIEKLKLFCCGPQLRLWIGAKVIGIRIRAGIMRQTSRLCIVCAPIVPTDVFFRLQGGFCERILILNVIFVSHTEEGLSKDGSSVGRYSARISNSLIRWR
jgi:hypothetical protein